MEPSLFVEKIREFKDHYYPLEEIQRMVLNHIQVAVSKGKTYVELTSSNLDGLPWRKMCDFADWVHRECDKYGLKASKHECHDQRGENYIRVVFE